MLNRQWIILVLLGMFFVLVQCTNQNTTGVIIPNQKPFEKLSDYQFFVGKINELQLNEKVLPYDLNSPLFSDYAEKARFVWMPENASAQYTLEGVLEFPVGTVLGKTFFYYKNKSQPDLGKQLIETRLLFKKENDWEAISYKWNEEQTEAHLDIIGDIKEVNWIDEKGIAQNVNYIIPNKNQCKSCHYQDGVLIPIGPKVRNLNKDFAYSSGNENQLAKWSAEGKLTGWQSTDNHPKAANWNDTESGTLHQRAMAYLDINCGHCHNPQGPAHTSGLNLTYNQPINRNLGINKSPVASGKGSGNRLFSIVKGHPEESIMVYRMESTDPGAMMPEIGRQRVHEEGVELIKEWITSL